MWDLINHTMHVVAQVGDGASAIVDQSMSSAAQTAPDMATAAQQGLTVPGTDLDLTSAAGQLGAETLQSAQSTAAVGSGGLEAAAVNQDMGMLGFIAQSDFVGKTLFGLLVLMSLISWYLIFAKYFVNVSRRARSRKFLKKFWSASSLEEVESSWAMGDDAEPFSRLTRNAINARNHHAKYGGTNLEESGSTAAFVTRTMRKVIDEETAKLENGLTVLASVGSTAPFVGLFGTVWGVYHALIGIGMSDGVTVNSIAGPVGEALIMTGLGLAVAIPAVLAYNGFVRSNRVYLASLDTFAHDLFSFLSTGQPVNGQPAPASQPGLRVASGGKS